MVFWIYAHIFIIDASLNQNTPKIRELILSVVKEELLKNGIPEDMI